MTGSPDLDLISTSYAERANLTMRMSMRRFTRLTNAFSKKLENHVASFALWSMWYNFGRVHQTLGKTPAMAAGIARQRWTPRDVINLIDSRRPTPGPRGPYKKRSVHNSILRRLPGGSEVRDGPHHFPRLVDPQLGPPYLRPMSDESAMFLLKQTAAHLYGLEVTESSGPTYTFEEIVAEGEPPGMFAEIKGFDHAVAWLKGYAAGYAKGSNTDNLLAGRD